MLCLIFLSPSLSSAVSHSYFNLYDSLESLLPWISDYSMPSLCLYALTTCPSMLIFTCELLQLDDYVANFSIACIIT